MSQECLEDVLGVQIHGAPRRAAPREKGQKWLLFVSSSYENEQQITQGDIQKPGGHETSRYNTYRDQKRQESRRKEVMM